MTAHLKENQGAGYRIVLPVFEGPFDLLFHLIQREEVDIWDIPLGTITRQYLEYIQSMRELEVDLAGEFLVMASSLLQLKSRLLLPSPPGLLSERAEEDLYFGSKEELVRCLLEYRRIKMIALALLKRQDEQQRVFLRAFNHQKVVLISRQGTIYPYAYEDLKEAARKLLQRREKEKKAHETVPVPHDNFSLQQMLQKIMQQITRYARSVLTLDDFLQKSAPKADIVTTFYALLELARRGHVRLRQGRAFSTIQVSKNDKKSPQG